MTRWMFVALALGVAACGGAPDEEISPPRIDSDWKPFAQQEHSVGELGEARFQIAACAYPEMVGAFPSCALDLPFILGHRTAIIVDLSGQDMAGATLRSTQGVVVVESARPEGAYLRALIIAEEPGDGSLVVEGPDGTQLDRLIVSVREATSVELTREDGGGPALEPGQTTTLRATALSEDGEILNAYSELRWKLLDGTGALRLHGTRGWRVDVEAMAQGDERLRTEVGPTAADLEMVVK